MSSYHRITSLLNTGGSEDAESIRDSTSPADTIRNSPDNNSPARHRTREGFAHNEHGSGPGSGPVLSRSYLTEAPPAYSSPALRMAAPLQMPPAPPHLPPNPVDAANSHSFSYMRANNPQRVLRQQPVYTSNDFRYWPYETQPQKLASASPALPHPASSSSLPSSVPDQNPQALTHTLIQQHMEAMYPGVMFDYSFHIRQRRTRACINCHAKKIKCEGNGPECISCVTIGIKCKWRPMKKRGPKPKIKEESPAKKDQKDGSSPIAPDRPISPSSSIKPANSNERDDSDQDYRSSYISTATAPGLNRKLLNLPDSFDVPADPSSRVEPAPTDKYDTNETLHRFYSDEVTEETRDAVTYYFDYFYGTSPMFHPAMFLRRVVEGTVDPMLIDAMRATTARIIAKKTGKVFDFESLASKIHQNIFSRIHNLTPDYIRAIILMGSYNGGEGDLLMYNSLAQLAVSLVIRLGWNTLDIGEKKQALSWEEWVNLEVKRRIFWFVHVMDSYQSLLGSRAGTIGDNRLFTSAPGSDETWDDITIAQCGSWPATFNPYETDENVKKKASLSHVFQELCNIATIASNVNDFLWDFGISLKTASTSHDLTPNIKYLQRPKKLALSFNAPISSAFECEEFRRLHHDVKRWRDSMLRTDELKSDWAPSYPFSEFGSYKHRLHIMRWRYFCYYAYGTLLYFLLHLSNRPSFFSVPIGDEDSGDESQKQGADTVEDNAIRGLLVGVFSKPIYDNFLAYDVIKESWDLCLEAVFDYVKFLDRNSDIPLERYDQLMPLSTFIAITVLVRHIRTLRRDIKQADSCKSTANSNIRQTREEFIKCVHTLQRLWSLLSDLGAVWKVKGMEDLLRIMQVEEMANTTELLSDMLI